MKLGRYEIISKLGTGGMGEVYLAKLPGPHGFEKKVVIKKILPHLSQDDEFIKRFIDEGKIVVKLSHGNIVQIYDMGIEDSEYFMAMEYVEGCDLKELLSLTKISSEYFPEVLTLIILKEICKGLSYAHTKTDEDGKYLNIVHRDLSPANIMLSMEGEVKICDFGVAKAASRITLSMPGILHGKYLYLSPEHARGDEIDYKSDIFSLGILGYEMLTYVRPFDGENDLEIIEKIKKFDPPPPSKYNSSLKPDLDQIIMRCLQKDRESRYASAHDLQSALTKYFHETHTIAGNDELKKYLKNLLKNHKKEQNSVYSSLDAAISDGLKQIDSNNTPRELTVNVEDLHDQKNFVSKKKTRFSSLTIFGSLFILLFVFVFYYFQNTLAHQETLYADKNTFTEIMTPITIKINTVINTLHEQNLLSTKKLNKSLILLTSSQNQMKEIIIEKPREKLITIRSEPAGGEVFIKGKSYGKTPVKIPVVNEKDIKGDIRLQDHKKAFFTITKETPPHLTLKLNPEKTGMITFRFFPANAMVAIDDINIDLKGKNLLNFPLSVGNHTITISSYDGTIKKSFKAKIVNEKTLNLGTIDISK